MGLYMVCYTYEICLGTFIVKVLVLELFIQTSRNVVGLTDMSRKLISSGANFSKIWQDKEEKMSRFGFRSGNVQIYFVKSVHHDFDQ